VRAPPWNRDLVEVAALALGDRALAPEEYVVPAVVVFCGRGAWERAKLARTELWLAEVAGHGRGAVTLLPPGESPWSYSWRALLHQVVCIYSTDLDAAVWSPLRDALLAAGADQVIVVDGQREQPRPIVGVYVPKRAAA
jgi:hypothetical protein